MRQTKRQQLDTSNKSINTQMEKEKKRKAWKRKKLRGEKYDDQSNRLRGEERGEEIVREEGWEGEGEGRGGLKGRRSIIR